MMKPLSLQTLLICIQAVAHEMKLLREEFEETNNEGSAYQQHFDRQRALDELEAQYRELSKDVINFPSFEELIGDLRSGS